MTNSAQSSPITVHQPTSLNIDSDSTDPAATTCAVPCLNNPSNTCVYQSYLRRRQYSVKDQPALGSNLFSASGINAANVFEQWSNVSTTCDLTPSESSDPRSTFPDSFYLCHGNCLLGGPGCSIRATQTITVNGISVNTETVEWACGSVTLTP